MFETLQIFLMNEQPTTCPYCGARCDELGNFYHTKAKRLIMKCLNENCLLTFFEDEEEYFLRLWKLI